MHGVHVCVCSVCGACVCVERVCAARKGMCACIPAPPSHSHPLTRHGKRPAAAAQHGARVACGVHTQRDAVRRKERKEGRQGSPEGVLGAPGRRGVLGEGEGVGRLQCQPQHLPPADAPAPAVPPAPCCTARHPTCVGHIQAVAHDERNHCGAAGLREGQRGGRQGIGCWEVGWGQVRR